MLPFLLLLVLATPSPDCERLQQRAQQAYDRPTQSAEQMFVTAGLLREARECLLTTDRRQAARMHVREIYLLNRSGYGSAYRASIEQYLERLTAADGQREYAFVLRHLATLESSRGNMAQAFAVLHRLLDTTPATQVRGRAETLLRIAELESKLANYRAALAYIARADSLVRFHLAGRAQKEQRIRVLIPRTEALLQWYDSDAARGDALEEARHAADEALSLLPYANPAERPHVLHMAGEVYTLLGDAATGERLLRRSTRWARTHDHFEYVMALSRLARHHLVRTPRDAADLRTGIDLAEEAYQLAVQQGYFYWARKARSDQALAAYASGDGAAAKRYTRSGIDLAEGLRMEAGATEWASSANSELLSPYRFLARLLVEEDSLAQALSVLERSRARYLTALQHRVSRLNTLDPRDAAHADSLVSRLTEAREALVTAPPSARDSLRVETARIQMALDTLVGPPPAPRPLDLAKVRRTLAADGRVVLYYVLDELSNFDLRTSLLGEHHQVSVYVLRADTLVHRRLDITPGALAALVRRIGEPFRVEAEAPAQATSPAFDLEVLHRLYQHLVAPVADLIPAQRPVTIVPDGALFAVPFAALVTHPTGRFAYGSAQYFGAAHPIQVALSLERDALPSEPGRGILLAGKARFARLDLPPLDGVRQEIRAVARLFDDADVLLDEDVTHARLAAAAQHQQIIHLATHALLDRSSPLYHALVLSPSAHDDGLLRLHEIEALRLHADLVTLSGCNTARGEVRPGEGMAGLQYAFRAVGARSTLSTLWSLSDAASAELFEAFYRNLAGGLPKDVALQRAQQQYRAAHPTASPFFWAAPVLYGSSQPIDVRAEPSGPRWPFAVLLLGLLAATAWLARRPLLSFLASA